MSETLVIEYAADAQTPVRAGAVAPGGAWLRDIAPDALAQSAGADAVAVIPGSLLAMHREQLPDFAPAKLLKILPGLMDEKVAVMDGVRHYGLFDAPVLPLGEDEELPVSPPGNRVVGVMDAEVLKTLLASVRAAGLTPVAVVADHMLLPVPESGENAGLIDGRVCVRRADGTGFTAEEDTAALMLAEGVTPERFGEEAWKRTLAGATDLAPGLMQGAFAPRGNMAAGLCWFRRAGILAAASVLLWAGSALYQAADNNSQADAYYAQSEAVFKDALPEVTRIVNMEAQMRRAVVTSRSQEGGEFLMLSDMAFRAVEGSDRTMLESLRYDADTGAVVLSVSFASFADGEAFKQSLQGLGAQVNEGGSRQEGNRVFSELTVRRGS